MPARRVDHNRVKLHRSYRVDELARCLGVHKNTVRSWQAKGLEPVDGTRPLLFPGASVRAFLANRKSNRTCKCPPGTIFCLRCRAPRAPALGTVFYRPTRSGGGNLRAHCECCGAVMNRRAREADIARIMPGCTVQHTQGPARLSGQSDPSLNCDLKEEG